MKKLDKLNEKMPDTLLLENCVTLRKSGVIDIKMRRVFSIT